MQWKQYCVEWHGSIDVSLPTYCKRLQASSTQEDSQVVDIPTRLNTAPMERSIRKWFYRYNSARPLVLTSVCPASMKRVVRLKHRDTSSHACREAKNGVVAAVNAGNSASSAG